MTEVVSVKFKGRGKSYYFDPAGITYSDGDELIVETSKGLETAQCYKSNHYVPDEKVVQPLRPIVRLVTDGDKHIMQANQAKEKEAFGICQKKIGEHGLDMKLVDVECSFEGNKVTFFFTSDGRVDFRDLVKDLASIFRSRIELRQIGVRDEAKMLGGIGICGRAFCCNQFLDEFQPVSTKMAKMQSMSLNPAKISGSCGRLMCCLRYEEEAYEELVKIVPKSGTFVETPAGYGTVTKNNLLRQTVKVKIDNDGEDSIKSYSTDEIAVIPGGRPKAGEPLPQLLKLRPAPVREPEDEPDNLWRAPSFAAEAAAATISEANEESQSSGKRRKNNRRGRSNKRPESAAAPAQDNNSQPQQKPRSSRPQKPKSQAPKSQGQGQKPQGQKSQGPKPQSPKNQGQKPQGQKPQAPKAQAPKVAQAPKPHAGDAPQDQTTPARNNTRRRRWNNNSKPKNPQQ